MGVDNGVNTGTCCLLYEVWGTMCLIVLNRLNNWFNTIYIYSSNVSNAKLHLYNKRRYVCLFVCLFVMIYVPYSWPNGWADRDETWHTHSCPSRECFWQGQCQGHSRMPARVTEVRECDTYTLNFFQVMYLKFQVTYLNQFYVYGPRRTFRWHAWTWTNLNFFQVTNLNWFQVINLNYQEYSVHTFTRRLTENATKAYQTVSFNV